MATATALAREKKVRFICGACGAVAPKWTGRCAACGDWNTLDEAQPLAGVRVAERPAPPLLPLEMVEPSGGPCRQTTGLAEVDRVLGGGIVKGSVVLLGGDPGVGKSTLALQMAVACAGSRQALYCSGEESAAQVAMRARRLGCPDARLALLVETDLDAVVAAIAGASAPLTVVDSVQTLYDPAAAGPPGSPTQVRNAVTRIVTAAKLHSASVLLVGHVTKDGAIAGPRTLEHMVDVVLYLEGDRLAESRMLRGVKNRFGSTGELGLLRMDGDGMRAAEPPGRALLSGSSLRVPGTVLTVSCDGVRPLVIEVQALAVATSFAMPRRTASGFDVNRLHVLLAVLEKRAELTASRRDVFLSIAGGVQVDDPAADLAVMLAVAGALRDRPLAQGCAVIGEVGLGGEIRPVRRLAARLAEAAAAGVKRAVVPAGATVEPPAGLVCEPVARLADTLCLA